MGQRLNVSKLRLQDIVTRIERETSFPNRTALYEAVAATEWAKNFQPKPLSATTISSKIKQLQIEMKTPKGVKGGVWDDARRKKMAKALEGSRGKVRKTRAQKFAANPQILKALDDLEKIIPERFLGLVEQARGGSLKAATKLKCLDCSSFQTAEIRDCPRTECSLWAFRAYQGKVEDDEQAPEKLASAG
jgi:hypothetical protein